MEILKSLELLDVYLVNKGQKKQLYIAGGAALRLQGLTSRSTSDIDVIAPRIDEILKELK